MKPEQKIRQAINEMKAGKFATRKHAMKASIDVAAHED